MKITVSFLFLSILITLLTTSASQSIPITPNELLTALDDTTQQSSSSSPNLSSNITVYAKYSYIRSYPDGGGIFIVFIQPTTHFSGRVYLQLTADSNLSAQIDKKYLDLYDRVAEITIHPKESIDLGTYTIEVDAYQFPVSTPVTLNQEEIIPESEHSCYRIQTLELDVEIMDYSSANLPNALIKRDELISWLETEHPEFGRFSNQSSYAYFTYPGILVVEHWTFLYKNWEMRICYHVMMYPYNWSKIWLRPRGKVYPVFAGCREYVFPALSIYDQEPHGDPVLVYHEIPVSEYPTFFGY
ncbi:MAG: hypothetical protein V1726_02975 [Methanobacteriota archaeon]